MPMKSCKYRCRHRIACKEKSMPELSHIDPGSSSSIGWHLRSRSCAVVAPDDRNLLILLRNSSFLEPAVSVGNSSAYS
jgi:hypothetical protein